MARPVQFAADAGPYEEMKARLLSGGRCALGYLGRQARYSTSDEAMADRAIRDYVAGYLREARIGLVVPGVDLDQYCSSLLQRFANPQIGDQLTRLCRRGSTKVPAYVLPSLRAALVGCWPRRYLVLALAAWLRYLRRRGYDGRVIDLEDAHAGRLQPLAEVDGPCPHRLLAQADIFGSLGTDLRLHGELRLALETLELGPLEAAKAVAGGADDGQQSQRSA